MVIPARFFLSLALLLPLFTVAVFVDLWFWAPPKPTGDGPDYEAIGYCLSAGKGWSTHFSDDQWRRPYESFDSAGYAIQLNRSGPVVPDTNRPPLFPLWISLVYRVVPRGDWAFGVIRLSLAAALAFGLALTAEWGWRLSKDSPNVGLQRNRFVLPWILLLVILSERNLRNYATDFLTEPFALLGMSIFLWVSWMAVERRSTRWGILAGVSFGLLIHCRSVFVLWGPFVMVVALFAIGVRGRHATQLGTEERRFNWKLATAFLLAIFVTVFPWWMRNILVLDSFQPLGTKGSTTLLGGYCDESMALNGEWVFAPEKALRSSELMSIQEETASAEELISLEKKIAKESSRRVRTWVADHWNKLPELAGKRLVTEWNPYTGKHLLFKMLAMVGVVGLWILDRRTCLWLVVPLAINSLVVVFTYSLGGRFLVPTYGCYYLLIGFGVLILWNQIESRWIGRFYATNQNR